MGTWWIDEPTLLGSSNPTNKCLRDFRAQGFTVVMSLLDESEQAPGYDIEAASKAGWLRYSIPIGDFAPPSLEQLREFNARLDRLPHCARVVVHCQGGSGRTGTMAAAYWIKKGLTATEAIARVRKARSSAVETCEQEKVLYQYAEALDREGNCGVTGREVR